MSSSGKKIEDLYRKKLGKLQRPVGDDVWDKVARRLPDPPKSGREMSWWKKLLHSKTFLVIAGAVVAVASWILLETGKKDITPSGEKEKVGVVKEKKKGTFVGTDDKKNGESGEKGRQENGKDKGSGVAGDTDTEKALASEDQSSADHHDPTVTDRNLAEENSEGSGKEVSAPIERTEAEKKRVSSDFLGEERDVSERDSLSENAPGKEKTGFQFRNKEQQAGEQGEGSSPDTLKQFSEGGDRSAGKQNSREDETGEDKVDVSPSLSQGADSSNETQKESPDRKEEITEAAGKEKKTEAVRKKEEQKKKEKGSEKNSGEEDADLQNRGEEQEQNKESEGPKSKGDPGMGQTRDPGSGTEEPQELPENEKDPRKSEEDSLSEEVGKKDTVALKSTGKDTAQTLQEDTLLADTAADKDQETSGMRIFIGLEGGYGSNFRTLKAGKASLVNLRNESESSLMNLQGGIRGGAYLWKELAASIGVGYRQFGHDFRYENSITLRDTTFEQDTTSMTVDTTGMSIDTVGMNIDTTYTTDTTYQTESDTNTTSQDSSFKHQEKVRYSYFTIPVEVSYDLEVGERLIITPVVGVGFNFLVKARSYWVDPDTYELVEKARNNDPPPFRPFALSVRGGLTVQYRFTDRLNAGIGFRYSQFVQSVYRKDVGIDEKPYRYGGNLSLRYYLLR